MLNCQQQHHTAKTLRFTFLLTRRKQSCADVSHGTNYSLSSYFNSSTNLRWLSLGHLYAQAHMRSCNFFSAITNISCLIIYMLNYLLFLSMVHEYAYFLWIYLETGLLSGPDTLFWSSRLSNFATPSWCKLKLVNVWVWVALSLVMENVSSHVKHNPA